MIPPKYDPLEAEKHILHYWKSNEIYKKSVEKNKKGKSFSFLQGPPYTNGKLHMGHAWNSSLKDVILRYKRMQGFNVWDRAGWDMHGLPIEHKVQDKLNLPMKDDIEKYGVDKFNKECLELCMKFKAEMDKDFERMALWLDYSDPYMPISNDYMEGQWWFIKKAHDDGRIYEGERTVTWCAHCSTALAKHELEYKEVNEPSIFVKFQVKDKPDEFLIIWTTTPWTIPFNLAVMVNPEVDYVKVKVGGEFWYVAKALVGVFMSSIDKKYQIVEEMTGDKLEGIEYLHPFADQIPQYKEIKEKALKTHTVVLSSEYVDTTGGTGLVHSAPGCGPEDYEVGYRNGIPPFNNISESGVFPKSMGEFAGLVAKKDDKVFIEALKARGALLQVTKVEHEYPHCWRCKKPVIFRTTKQWFLKSEDLRDKIVKNDEDVNWVPKDGSDQFQLWIKNLRDNSITRQRYWGTAVPIWRCPGCNEVEVIGSLKELEKKSKQKVVDMHKPAIDAVKFKCKCGGMMERIPDVLDVWLDSGSAGWNCFRYPKDKKDFKKRFPADLVLEGREQIRLWFYMLSLNSEIAFQKNAYKNAYCTGMLLSVDGEKMSKSLGNIISPYEIIDKHGVDTMRYYVSGIRAGQNVSFSWDEIAQKNRNLIVLWNLHKYIADTAVMSQINPAKLDRKVMQDMFDIEEKYIVSRVNSALKKVTELLDNYELDSIVEVIEDAYLELSRTYVQLVREKLTLGEKEEKEVVLFVLYDCLDKIVRMFHLVCPFMTEQMFLNMKEAFGLEDESIVLGGWPDFDKKLIDEKLETEFELAQSVMQSILFCREKVKLGVRWPLKEVVIASTDDSMNGVVKDLGALIKTQTNVKELVVKKSMPGVKVGVLADFNKIASKFKADSKLVGSTVAGISNDKILASLDKDEKVFISAGGKEFVLVREHFIISKEIGYPYVFSDFKKGTVYVNQERTDELEAEGFARELVRRVQAARKNAGFNKSDKIVLFVKTGDKGVDVLKSWVNDIQERVNASHIKISQIDPAKKHVHHVVEKIKELEFELFFD